MSEMNFDQIEQDRRNSSYTGYEGAPQANDDFTASYGQKISPQTGSRTAPSGQRLALAIVSLVLWMLVFLIVAITISTISPDNPVSRVAFPFLISALLIFSAIVFFINFLFNRKH